MKITFPMLLGLLFAMGFTTHFALRHTPLAWGLVAAALGIAAGYAAIDKGKL